MPEGGMIEWRAAQRQAVIDGERRLLQARTHPTGDGGV
jgi:hypothetical protein